MLISNQSKQFRYLSKKNLFSKIKKQVFFKLIFQSCNRVRQKMVIVNTTVMVDKMALTAQLQPSVEQMHRTILPLSGPSLTVESVLTYSEIQTSSYWWHSFNSGSFSFCSRDIFLTMNSPLKHFKELHFWKAKKTTNVTRKNLA